jgi:hypothetical protein
MKATSQIRVKRALVGCTRKPQICASQRNRYCRQHWATTVHVSTTSPIVPTVWPAVHSFSTISLGGDQAESIETQQHSAQTAELDNSNAAENQPQISKLQKIVDAGEMDEAYVRLNAMIESEETPTSVDYKCFLEGLKRAKGRKSADMAMTVLQHYKNYIDAGTRRYLQENLTPHYNCVLNLWLTCTTPPQRIKLKNVRDIFEVSKLASSILHDMQSRKDCRPTRTAYNLALNCHVQTAIAATKADKRGENHEETLEIALLAAEEAEATLMQMIAIRDEARKPDIESLRSLLTAWANVRSIDGSERILSILETLEENLGVLDASLYSIVFHAFAQTASLKEFDPSDPTAPANMSVALLRRLVPLLSDEGGRPSGPLDAMCYASVINAFAKSWTTKDFGELAPANLADACLRQCSELHEIGYLKEKPNDYCYGNTIAAWTRHVDIDLGFDKAQALMKRFEAHVGQKTDATKRRQRMTIWYNMVLYALSKSTSIPDAPEVADNILQRMISTSIADDRSYEAVLSVLAKASHNSSDRAKRAETLLASMEAPPPVMCYNMALAACAATGSEHAVNGLKIAEKLFADIPRPNPASYSRMISVYKNLLSGDQNERETRIARVFEQCVADGMVSKLVLNVMSTGAPSTGMGKLFGKYHAQVSGDVNKLPKAWTRKTGKQRVT